MRELNECKAEIFRRSEERIKQRKKARNRVLAFCIPLCLCLAVCSASFLPAILYSDKSAKNEAADMLAKEECEYSEGSLVCSYVTAEIRNMNGTAEDYQEIRDKAEVTRIFEVLYSVFPNIDGSSKGDKEFGQKSNVQDYDTNAGSKKIEYKITLTAADGSYTVYTFSDNKLCNLSTGQTIALSDEQLSELKETLNLPD